MQAAAERQVVAHVGTVEIGGIRAGSASTLSWTPGLSHMISTVAVIASRVVSKPATRAAPRIMLCTYSSGTPG